MPEFSNSSMRAPRFVTTAQASAFEEFETIRWDSALFTHASSFSQFSYQRSRWTLATAN
jgi:hypothetical protein